MWKTILGIVLLKSISKALGIQNIVLIIIFGIFGIWGLIELIKLIKKRSTAQNSEELKSLEYQNKVSKSSDSSNDERDINTPIISYELNNKAKNELRVFKKFAKVCPYPINFDSIENREPPEPDIFCKFLNDNPLTFEIVQCFDTNIARSIQSVLNVKQGMLAHLEKLSTRKKQFIKILYEDALISVCFCKGISEIKKQQSIPLVFDFLYKIATNKGEAEYNSQGVPNFRGIIEYISVKRGFENGPLFDIVPEPVCFSDTSMEQIKVKFNKHYETENKIELVCFYELQPELHENRWLPEVEEFVQKNVKSSPFERIWIYSITKDKIIYVYPKPDKTEDTQIKDVDFRDYRLQTRLLDLAKKINLLGISTLILVVIGFALNIDLHPAFYIIATITGIGLMFKSEEMKKADNLFSRLLIGFGQGFFLIFVIGGLFWAATSNWGLILNMIEKVISGEITLGTFFLLLFALVGPISILILIFRGWKGFKEFIRPDKFSKD